MSDEAGGASGGAGGAPSTREPVREIPPVDESELPEPKLDAGFIELEPVKYWAPLEVEFELQSEPARIFYNFIPADEGAKEKPLFVFFNGGPGVSTALLRCFGTGPFTLDASDFDAELAPNANSFTQLGSLLYIDSRQAGFSYGLAEEPESQEERELGLQKSSFNTARDAADFAIVIVRVLRKFQALRNNAVVMVGESYGGTRSAVLLDILTDPETSLKAQSIYVEPTWKTEIDTHFESVFDAPAGALGRRSRARQFGHQILIQPLLFGGIQYAHTSPMQVKGRCSYNQLEPSAWCDQLDAATDRVMTQANSFEKVVGVAPESVRGLAAPERQGAFRIGQLESFPESELNDRLGELQPWDAYYRPWTGAAGRGTSLRGFEYVNRNLITLFRAHTLITNAQYDAVIQSSAILEVLRSVPDLEVSTDAMGEEIPTRILLQPKEGQPATIAFPTYQKSGHSVTVSEPDKFFADVKQFLTESGLIQ